MHSWRYCNEKWPWHFTKIFFYYNKPMWSSWARRLQLTIERHHLTVRKKVWWCRAIQFQHFPKKNVIFKNARISIPTTRVLGKYPRVRQICPQMEKLIFSETWKMNWGSAKATNHCGTLSYSRMSCYGTDTDLVTDTATATVAACKLLNVHIISHIPCFDDVCALRTWTQWTMCNIYTIPWN